MKTFEKGSTENSTGWAASNLVGGRATSKKPSSQKTKWQKTSPLGAWSVTDAPLKSWARCLSIWGQTSAEFSKRRWGSDAAPVPGGIPGGAGKGIAPTHKKKATTTTCQQRVTSPGARNQPGRGRLLCGWDPGQVPGQDTVSGGEKWQALIQPVWGPSKGKGGHRHTEGPPCEDPGKRRRPQAKERPWEEPGLPHRDLGRPASRTERNNSLLWKLPQKT